jgi:hypothetical protein
MQLHLNRKIEVLLRLFMGCHVRFPWQIDIFCHASYLPRKKTKA